MASPFNVFRRNQKTLLVAASLMAMFVFVLGDPIMKYFGSPARSKNPIVVKLNSHSYHASELMALMHSRQIIRNFLQRLAVERVQKAIEAGQRIPRSNIAAISENLANNWRQQLMDRMVPPDEIPSGDDDAPRQAAQSLEEAQAIQTVVLAEAAEKHGIIVTDTTVNEYLKFLTDNMISGAEFEKVVASLRSDAGNMSQGYLFDSLRRELLASRYSLMFQVGLISVPPASRWECFQQLNRRATAEVLGVPVDQYVKDVAEPSEAEAKAFFEKYAHTLPVPNSPNPGFKRPAKAAFQYFLAKFSDFNDRALAQVTPEEVREYYEKNKDVRYRERDHSRDADTGEIKSDDTKADDTKSDDKPDDTKSGDTSGTGGTPGSDQPEKAGADDAGGDKKPAPAPATDGEKKSSRAAPASSFRLTALAQKTDDKKPGAATADDKPADSTPSDDKPADAATDEKPAGNATDEPASADEKSASEAPAAETPAGDKPGGKKEVAYEPFEKVEEEIKKTLASEKANKEIGDVFQRLTGKMRQYARDRGVYEVDKEENATLEPPEPLDLPALASAEGLTAHETKLVSADELAADTDLGKAFATPLDPQSPYGFRLVPFPQIGFSDRLFQPEVTEDNEGNRFLSWKTEQTPEGVPDFDEVRREVVRELKLIQARKLALAAAEELAKEAHKAEKPLSELFAGREGFEVVDTGAFTWMTTGAPAFDPNANQPHLSDVHGVQAAGQEFMQAVFDSTPGQIPVAMNEPKTVAYVIQIKDFEPARDDLEQQFLVEDFRKYARLAMNDEQVLYVDWLRWLDRQAGVTWLNPGFVNRRMAD